MFTSSIIPWTLCPRGLLSDCRHRRCCPRGGPQSHPMLSTWRPATQPATAHAAAPNAACRLFTQLGRGRVRFRQHRPPHRWVPTAQRRPCHSCLAKNCSGPLRHGQLDRPPAMGTAGPPLSGQWRRQHHHLSGSVRLITHFTWPIF